MSDLIQQLGNIDLYLLDQLMKGRITKDMRILDAGFGHGRNAQYFIERDFDIWGVDQNAEAKTVMDECIQIWNPNYDPTKFSVGSLEEMAFPNQHFDFIISSAVLHFAQNHAHFTQLFEEHLRVLKAEGIFWFRMTTLHTISRQAELISLDGLWELPDGTIRYLLELENLNQLMVEHELTLLDPFKTVNVADSRTMSVAVLQRE